MKYVVSFLCAVLVLAGILAIVNRLDVQNQDLCAWENYQSVNDQKDAPSNPGYPVFVPIKACQ